MSGEKDILADFIKRYGKPYDHETDDYDVPPFQENIENASKSSKIYNMHMYWTKQDPYVVKRYIEHYTKPGNIVLDAFAGTGMTGVAAMIAGRHAILCEISPACIHIARNYTTPIDQRVLKKAYQELMEKVEPETRPIYKTKCHKCGNQDAQIANTILSDVYECPRCRADVLFAGDGRWERMKSGGKFNKIKCGNCGHEFSKASANFARVEPVEIRVDCKKCRVKGESKAKPLDDKDWELYIKIEGGNRFCNELGNKVLQKMLVSLSARSLANEKTILPKEPPYWYPKDVEFFGDEPKRNLKRGITHPYQMFSRRNLIALSILWHYISPRPEKNTNKLDVDNKKRFFYTDEVKEKLRFSLTASMSLMSMMSRWKRSPREGQHIGPAIMMGTLYIPSMIQDVNVLQYYIGKTKQIIQSLNEYLTAKGRALVLKKSAARIQDIQDSIIDYLFYDPPYGSNINYSELNIMWEAWLGETTDIKEEIIENDAQGKGRAEYEEMMTQALREAYRVLKPGRWLSIVYSYSDPSMYRTVQKMAHSAGFIDEGEIVHVNSARKTKAQLDSDKTQQRFLVINFKKPKIDQVRAITKSPDIEFEVVKVVQEFLTKNPGRTRDYIYDEVIKKLFASVQIQQFDLDEILKNFFRKVGDEWYAPGTLITRKTEDSPQGKLFQPETPEHPEKEVVLKLQEFLKKFGSVPYAELREFYLRKLNIPIERSFDELVSENFVVDKGKVRLPTPQEQQRMQDINTRYRIRTVRHYLEGNFKEPAADSELCDWIEFCYQNEFYKEGARVFLLINEAAVEPEGYKRIKKIAEVCRIKTE